MSWHAKKMAAKKRWNPKPGSAKSQSNGGGGSGSKKGSKTKTKGKTGGKPNNNNRPSVNSVSRSRSGAANNATTNANHQAKFRRRPVGDNSHRFRHHDNANFVDEKLDQQLLQALDRGLNTNATGTEKSVPHQWGFSVVFFLRSARSSYACLCFVHALTLCACGC